jgi:uncharacterized MAPEG superfamily protein
MTIPFWCLFITVLIPYVLAGIGVAQRQAQLGSVDNKDWRKNQLPALTGLGSRVYAAQANTWEAVALFTAAVTVAHLAGADPESSTLAAILFLAARVLHTVLYLADLDKLRSLIFVVGFGSCMWLFGLAISAG